jgi:hypothetical protein
LQKIEDPNSEISPTHTCEDPEESPYDDLKKDLEKRDFQKGSNYETSPQTAENVYETLKQKEEVNKFIIFVNIFNNFKICRKLKIKIQKYRQQLLAKFQIQ